MSTRMQRGPKAKNGSTRSCAGGAQPKARQQLSLQASFTAAVPYDEGRAVAPFSAINHKETEFLKFDRILDQRHNLLGRKYFSQKCLLELCRASGEYLKGD